MISLTFCLASFLGVVAVSVGRFLAIHLHLRYQELVTHKRVVAVVISIWLLGVICPVQVAWLLPNSGYSCIITFPGMAGLVLTTLVLHQNLLHRATPQESDSSPASTRLKNNEMASFARLLKFAVGTFYVYLVILICYLPMLICFGRHWNQRASISLKSWYIFSVTLVLLGSSLNPVIYCWKMRHIRHAIIDMLRNMPWLTNRVSHLS